MGQIFKWDFHTPPVVVKSKIGRRRYIIAENSPEMKRAVKKIMEFEPWCRVVLVQKKFAVVRCRHWNKERVINVLNDFGIKTCRTTGTIKKAKRIIESLLDCSD